MKDTCHLKIAQPSHDMPEIGLSLREMCCQTQKDRGLCLWSWKCHYSRCFQAFKIAYVVVAIYSPHIWHRPVFGDDAASKIWRPKMRVFSTPHWTQPGLPERKVLRKISQKLCAICTPDRTNLSSIWRAVSALKPVVLNCVKWGVENTRPKMCFTKMVNWLIIAIACCLPTIWACQKTAARRWQFLGVKLSPVVDHVGVVSVRNEREGDNIEQRLAK